MKARTFISATFMGLWPAMLIPQLVVVDAALGKPPALTETAVTIVIRLMLTSVG